MNLHSNALYTITKTRTSIKTLSCLSRLEHTKISLLALLYIYIYIKWTVFFNVTIKSAQHAHARMIAIIVEKSPNSSHMYDHGFMDNTNRQAVCKSQKKILWVIHKQQKNYIENHKNTPQSIKKTCYNIKFKLINTTLLHRCSYTSEYNAETRFSCIWD